MSNSNTPLVNISLDDVLSLTPAGPSTNAISNNLYGINHRQIYTQIPINKDQYGFTFFTRPQLNLSGDNIRNVRTLSPLLSTNTKSYQKYLRCMLDPRLIHGYGTQEVHSCPLIDNTNAFIPLLTNNLKSITGWKDIEVPTFTAKEGAYKEGWAIVDGIVDDYTTYQITANFRNQVGDPITALFGIWARYMANVFEGKLIPYPDYIVENMIDYNTRIYRLVLDKNKVQVQGIMATGAAFPSAVSIGNRFDYAIDTPYNTANAEISIPFTCMGQIWNDDILILEFNRTVEIFNPGMTDAERSITMTQIPIQYLSIFNNRGYPRINPDTYQLEWWVSAELFNSTINALGQVNNILGIQHTQPVAKTYSKPLMI